MPYSVKYHPKFDCVFAKIEGKIDIKIAQEFAKEAIKQTAEHNCRKLLNDLRKAQVKLSTFDIYHLPSSIEKAGLDHLCKRALLVSRDFDDYRFFENISRSHGHLVEIFTDSDTFSLFRNIRRGNTVARLALPAPRIADQSHLSTFPALPRFPIFRTSLQPKQPNFNKLSCLIRHKPDQIT
jgi:hypothetical protein